MKIGIIADGQAEVVALRELLAKVEISDSNILNPLYADMQPTSGPAQIFKAAESRLAILNQRGCDKIVVLIDHENRNGCPGVWAHEIATEFWNRGYGNVSVVVKQKAFENWLVADLESVREKYPRRYNIRDGLIDRIKNSGADNVNAINLLDNCAKDGYCKRKDAIDICKAVSPSKVARNSRSFRRFLRILGHNDYTTQSSAVCA